MNAIVLVDFHDNAKDVDRKRGEEFVVSKARFEEINSVGMEVLGKPLVGAVEEKTSPESRGGKAQAKQRTAKKAAK